MSAATLEGLTDDTIIVSRDAIGSPFAGLTYAQAKVLNSAFAGLPVEVYGGRYDKGPHVYIFGRLRLPGDWRSDPFQEAGDLVLLNTSLVKGCYLPIGGSYRVLGVALIQRMDALSIEPQYRICSSCSRAMPITEKVYDVGGISNIKLPDGTWEWGQRLECAQCWFGDW